MLDLGLPPSRPGLGVDLRGLTQVIDYPARDMTITVQAGITIARLQELLRGENQRLPIDVPRAADATLGGALAVNASGPRRYGFGTLRDYVIGITVINDEGQETKAGGRVVKNVAGYDLCKLHVGALGTLGIISQVTLKLRPRPEDSALCFFAAESASLPDLLNSLSTTQTRPVCIEVLNRLAVYRLNEAGAGVPTVSEWLLAVGFEENREAVAWQLEQLRKERASQNVEVRAGPEAAPVWDSICGLGAGGESRLIFQANLLPHVVAEFCLKAAGLSNRLLLQAHAGNGIVLGHLDGEVALDSAQTMLQTLGEQATAAQGNLIIRRCPSEWKKSLPVWGAPRGDLALMRAVKEKLDPRNLFNPGRYLVG
jgi:glycolate oxidase FAD binding subunit